MSTTAPPDLNHAAAALIEALDDVDAMAGFREGLQRTAEFAAAALGSMPAEARQSLAVWQALDALCGAIQQRKKESL